MGLLLRSSSLANSGNSITIKGSALAYNEADGNFMYLLTNMSGSTISITGSTVVAGNFAVSGTVKFPTLSSGTDTDIIFYNSSSGQLFHTSSIFLSVGTASFVTSSNVYGPFGANSIVSASYASSSLSASYAATASFINPLIHFLVKVYYC
jgi:hypothetical protein